MFFPRREHLTQPEIVMPLERSFMPNGSLVPRHRATS